MSDHRASRTAIVVAKSQALAGASHASSGPPVDPAAVEFSRRALEISGHGRFVRNLESITFRRAMRLYESVMIPGLAKHHVLRKNYIEQRVREALRSGTRQVVQIGAGLDSLCYRLHRDWPGTTFIEFDHPSTQTLKREVLGSFETDNNLELKPLDLAGSDPASFAEVIGDGSSMIVVEGVLMYLPQELVAAWLKNWQRLGGLGSRLLFTFMEKSGFRNQSLAVNGWLKLAGEPFRWCANRRAAAALLRENGWEPQGEHATWWEPAGLGAAEGEWISEALVRSNPV